MKEYIKERMKDYAKNIADFSIGDTVLDKDNAECVILNKTENSIEVFLKKKSAEGINCSQWFPMSDFNKQFKTK